MTGRDTRDILGGVLLTMVGIFFALHARNYAFGEAARMGPGYFPTVLGWLLAVLGVAIAVPALRRPGEPMVVRWKSLALVLAAVLVFAFGLNRFGLVPTVSATVFIASLADDDLRWKGRLVLSIAVPVLMVAIFVQALSMNLALFAWQL
ncbi:tripartite tricarboxylate transporter TctB family protein [Ramlibacter sp. AN1015]|uniref:tripartite tricarboxylate transporter TctB family protein n=1 Tax=Ramlibacter sp. AN1015 TaxID=3133428 RepID=UPI0030C607E6